jgi:hypothetical protein
MAAWGAGADADGADAKTAWLSITGVASSGAGAAVCVRSVLRATSTSTSATPSTPAIQPLRVRREARSAFTRSRGARSWFTGWRSIDGGVMRSNTSAMDDQRGLPRE